MSRILQWLPLLLTAGALLSACASAPEEPASGSQAKQYTEDFLDEFTRTKVRKNGPSLFCDQSGYLGCYEISRSQCLQELSGVSEECFARTEQKFPQKLKTEADIDEFATYYAVCMSLRHLAMHSGRNVEALGACLKQVKWDKEQRDRSFLK